MEKIPKTAREKYQFEIDNLNLQIKELRDKLNTNNAEWIDRCKKFRKQDADKADAKYDATLTKVLELVEAAKEIDDGLDEYWSDLHSEQIDTFRQAIAAVEAALKEVQ